MVGMPMDEKRPDIVELVAVLKALSDPTRLVILDLLMQGVQCNCYLGDRLGLPMNLISHHLKVLREQLSAFLDPRRIQLRLPTCGPQFAGKETAHVTR
jgi:DNA-binding transcriptional ArsR family regulator